MRHQTVQVILQFLKCQFCFYKEYFPFSGKKNKDITFLLYKSIFQKVVCYLVYAESTELEGKLISLTVVHKSNLYSRWESQTT